MTIFRGTVIYVAVGSKSFLTNHLKQPQPFSRKGQYSLNNLRMGIDDFAILILGDYCNHDQFPKELGQIKNAINMERVIGICDYRTDPKDLELTIKVKAFAGLPSSPLFNLVEDPTALSLKVSPDTDTWSILKKVTSLRFLRITGCAYEASDRIMQILRLNTQLNYLHIDLIFDRNLTPLFLAYFFKSAVREASGIKLHRTQELNQLRNNGKTLQFKPFNGQYDPALSYGLANSKEKLAVIHRKYDAIHKLEHDAILSAFNLRDTEALVRFINLGLEFKKYLNPISSAVKNLQYDFVRFLLGNGMPVTLIQEVGIHTNDEEMIELMIKHGLQLATGAVRSYKKTHSTAMTVYLKHSPPAEKQESIEDLTSTVRALSLRVCELEKKVEALMPQR